MKRTLLALAAIACAGCNLFGETPSEVDSGTDAGSPNAQNSDGGMTPADIGGAEDTGIETDVGESGDGGVVLDMGADDGGAPDLGTDMGIDMPDPGFAWVEIGVAKEHACALDNQGRIFCWGQNNNGELADGSLTRRTTPVQVSSTLFFTDLAVGDDHTCALDDAQAVWCWGLGEYIGSPVDQISPFQPNTMRFKSIAAGHDNVCGIDLQDQMWCWGDNDYAQLGVAASNSVAMPVQSESGAGVTAMALGNEFTCVLDSTGSPLCWGRELGFEVNSTTAAALSMGVAVTTSETYDEIAAGEAIACARHGTTVDCWGFGSMIGNETVGGAAAVAGPVPTNVDFAQVDVGANHACAATADGQLYCWGSNYRARQGIGTDNPSSGETNPVTPVDTTARFVDFSIGEYHGCGITTDQQILCWGLSNGGRLGNGELGWTASPVMVDSAQTFVSVLASEYHTCAISAANKAFCWGRGRYQALGNGSLDHQMFPTLVPGIDASFVTGEDSAILTLAPDGTASSWGGEGTNEELGNGIAGDRLTPGPLDTMQTFDFASLGNSSGCAISGNTTYCWGAGGQNGISANTLASPTAMPNGSPRYVKISIGGGFGCGITGNGSASCFGENGTGELGTGDTVPSEVPVDVLGGITFTDILAGDDTSCGIDGSGNAHCWGEAGSGRLGNGSGTDQSSPQLVSGGHTFASLANNAARHTCAITTTGDVYCWGEGLNGKLGDGNTSDNSTPAIVNLPEPATEVSGGDQHTCAVVQSGAVYCWGYQGFGRLGDGFDAISYSPSPVDLSGIVIE